MILGAGHDHISCPAYAVIEIGSERSRIMFFGKKDKDVRLTDAQYKELTSKMNKRERREFDRKQEQLRQD